MVQHTAVATLHTTQGDIKVNLFGNQAPKTVRNFIGLATGDTEWTDPRTGKRGDGPLYANVVFHRIIPGFMIQGGDPTGTGMGGPGYTIPDELDDTEDYSAGALAMAKTQFPDSGGSQFFLVYDDSTGLPKDYTTFGTIDAAGLKVLRQVAAKGTADGAPDGAPKESVTISWVTIG